MFYPIEDSGKEFSSVFLMPADLKNEEKVDLTYKLHIENSAGKQFGDQQGV